MTPADGDDAIGNREILQKIDQDGDDAIVRKIMIHLLLLPLADDDAIAKRDLGIAGKNLIATLLLNHLLPDAAAAKNHVLPGHHLQKIAVLKNLHHHNLLGEKDSNPVLQGNN